MSSADQYEVRVCWGYFDIYGNWFPNPFIEISEDEQFRCNVENGFIPLNQNNECNYGKE